MQGPLVGVGTMATPLFVKNLMNFDEVSDMKLSLSLDGKIVD